ncbi:biliverdin-producing heme oxygenase [Leptospira borgpetersenii]|uniref:biliverdin-producing heme oxygenase n=1 Tax=Leptospira borgpetersenii TaxID=174 RepID=UPI0007732FE4|nr:biliverdin-producing heme oxygenase [Leptospira borgpetersenii]MBE8398872.1 biliverdin-producing heme oxygenase [Leptospira borgpetersenii serovar Tarassovi]MBE8401936.1 biliverdin-producing heme oxygenase [Leptospira borgpetersenii serovar Tarassovi]MBE8404958.1 biliverdin-producing heme oxygenase [Leptospira borgpetersenii serovar Tarassovi]MBE8411301.1 biliverdin-producing heme oxygenase [Leptospira borgpetersenii serovar Tarassovi]MBE8417298.1 biliverdin-producing heme oxygenase [Leptos
MSFATILREGTSEEHKAAEGSTFIRCFMKGILEKGTYTKHLEAFYFVYESMEEELERHTGNVVLKSIHFPELYRKGALLEDLQFFYETWKPTDHQPSAATQVYVKRIRNISETRPELLAAHSYVRYLGDLSGGQILKKVAARALNLPEGQGISFYEFPAIQDINGFKQNYRAALDSLPVNDSEKQAILSESKQVFLLNQGIFSELEQDLISAIGKEVYDTVLGKG